MNLGDSVKKISEMNYDELLMLKKISSMSLNGMAGLFALSAIYLKNPLPLLSVYGVVSTYHNIKTITEKYMSVTDEDIKIMKNIYEDILLNFTKMAKTIDIDNSIEVFIIFFFMKENGFFSFDKDNNHVLKLSRYKDSALDGLLSLNGHGVCRHNALFLHNLYTKLGFTSDISTGSLNKGPISLIDDFILEYGYSDKYTTAELNKIFITKYIKTGLIPKILYKSKNKYTNHAITRVNFNDSTILTDPTNGSIFIHEFAGIFKSFPSYDSIFILNEDYTSLYNKAREIEEIELNYDYKLEEILSAVMKTYIKLSGITDIISNFYKENKDIYIEAENIMQKVLKKRY